MATTAERVRQERDLRPQIAGLGGLEGEVLFQHIRTGQNLVTLYALSDGEAIPMPEKLIAAAMGKRDAEGNWMFTDTKEDAPEYVQGTVKCFLHSDSIERTSGLLAEVGLAGKSCERKGGLGSEFSKTKHGETRHKQEWAAMVAFGEAKEKREDRETTRKQLEATLALARGAKVTTGTTDNLPVVFPCDQCDTEAKSAAGLSAHIRGAHKEA